MGKVILDADFLISLWLANQSTHLKAVEMSQRVRNHQVFILDVTTYEMASLIGRRFYKELMPHFKRFMQEVPVTVIDSREFEAEIWDEFWSHPKKGISFVDCANKVIAERWKCKIASFDDFYPEELRV